MVSSFASKTVAPGQGGRSARSRPNGSKSRKVSLKMPVPFRLSSRRGWKRQSLGFSTRYSGRFENWKRSIETSCAPLNGWHTSPHPPLGFSRTRGPDRTWHGHPAHALDGQDAGNGRIAPRRAQPKRREPQERMEPQGTPSPNRGAWARCPCHMPAPPAELREHPCFQTFHLLPGRRPAPVTRDS